MFKSPVKDQGLSIRSDSKKLPKRFDEQAFKTIVAAAKTRTDTNSSNKVFTLITHLSELRTDPLSQYKAEDVIETLKRGIVVLQFKFNEHNNQI